jgi:hypothetical protein
MPDAERTPPLDRTQERPRAEHRPRPTQGESRLGDWWTLLLMPGHDAPSKSSHARKVGSSHLAGSPWSARNRRVKGGAEHLERARPIVTAVILLVLL